MKKTSAKKTAQFRMTPQRAAILRILDGNKTHPSAEEIHKRLRAGFPGMSFATVYNTLQSLISAGVLGEIRIDPARSRFDPGLKYHTHLMCVRCGRITDLPARAPAAPKGAPRGFKILRCNMEFYGICPACAHKAGNKEKRSCTKKERKS